MILVKFTTNLRIFSSPYLWNTFWPSISLSLSSQVFPKKYPNGGWASKLKNTSKPRQSMWIALLISVPFLILTYQSCWNFFPERFLSLSFLNKPINYQKNKSSWQASGSIYRVNQGRRKKNRSSKTLLTWWETFSKIPKISLSKSINTYIYHLFTGLQLG